MDWIKCDNELKPILEETYWVTINFCNEEGIVIEATYKNDGWYSNGKKLSNVFAWFNVPKPLPCEIPKSKGLEFPDFEVNKNGINKKIKVNLLSEDRMKELGFTDYCKDRWYYCRELSKDISFSVSIPKENPDDFRIDILDENFCQPYDYQSILSKNKENKIALEIMNKVEIQMDILKTFGIIKGHIRGEYI